MLFRLGKNFVNWGYVLSTRDIFCRLGICIIDWGYILLIGDMLSDLRNVLSIVVISIVVYFVSILRKFKKIYFNVSSFPGGMERSYRSDDTEDAGTTDNPTSPFPTQPPANVSPRSPLPLHRQASPFPLESVNSRRVIYATPQDRLRGTNGKFKFSLTSALKK